MKKTASRLYFKSRPGLRLPIRLFLGVPYLVLLGLTACSGNGADKGPTISSPGALTDGTPTWSYLNLSGQLIYTVVPENQMLLVKLDLATGQKTTLFQPPTNGWLHGFALAPDGGQIVLAYAPPTPEGGALAGHSGLFLIPAEGSDTPQSLLISDRLDEAYFTPTWSPDGRYLYYAHYQRISTASGPQAKYDLERRAYPDGQAELLVENALWPGLSPDGAQLAYITFDPLTTDNHLFLADADGKNSRPAIADASFPAVDAHFFTPDGSALVFSAVSDTAAPAGLSWFDRLLGVRAAAAHSVPSDWWRVPVAGGQPEQLTNILDIGLNGAYAPDGQHIAFIAASGVYVMNPDGSELTKLSGEIAAGGIAWTP